jgi:hypothetical protein
MIAALLLVSVPAPPACPLIWPVAPDEAAARRIAEAVIASRPSRPRRRYILRVVPDRDDPALWVAFQSLPPPRRPARPNEIVLQAGGGGLEMRIDRCTGAISRLFYER